MSASQNRILTSHVGALPRPLGLPGMRPIPEGVKRIDPADATVDIVKQQRSTGIDIANDGEFGKVSFLHYVRDRIGGMNSRDLKEGERHSADDVAGRDMKMFPGYFKDKGALFPYGKRVTECTEPLRYVGQEAVAADVRNLRNALKAAGADKGFLTAISPLTVTLAFGNAYYKSEEEYGIAAADALREEYKAIVDGGFMLQIDDPGFAHGWQAHPDWSLEDCKHWCAKGVELVNYALRDIPPERVRFHMCWGSYHGPHAVDLELKHLVDLLYKINVSCYSIEGGNARHEHEWQVFTEAKLPDGKSIMPGVVSHATDTIEHPELVAQRLERYAKVVGGAERVIGGTDCGMMRVHPEICWAKLSSLVEGAKLASARL